MNVLDVLNQLKDYGPLMSGIGLINTGAAAWYTARRVTHRNSEKDRAQREETERRRASDVYQALCSEFWHDPDVTFVRRCLVNEKEYPDISVILAKRNATEYNELSRQDNDVIEQIDRFCFLLLWMKVWAETGLLDPTLGNMGRKGRKEFWIAIMKKRRPEFLFYVRKHWSELGDDVGGIDGWLPLSTFHTKAPHDNTRRRPPRKFSPDLDLVQNASGGINVVRC